MGPRDTACQPLPQLWANSITVLCNVVISTSSPTEVGGKVHIQMKVRILFDINLIFQMLIFLFTSSSKIWICKKRLFSFTGRIKHIWAGHRRVQERREPVEPWIRCRCKEEEVALGCIRDTSQTVQHVSAGPQQQLSVPQAGAQLQDALPRYAAFFLTIHML